MIHQLADFIATSPYVFNMNGYKQDPTTDGACILSHARLLWPELNDGGDELPWDDDLTCQKLGIDHDHLMKIGFYQSGRTREEAVEMLRNLANTGEVKWPDKS